MDSLHTFTALDFETAQGKRHSICQIGLVRVEQNVITQQGAILVRPPDNFYSAQNIAVHGITPEMTRNALTFDQIWPRLKPYICDQNIVAHNSAFDISCLQQTLAYYRINVPGFKSHCTYKIYGQKLNLLCKTYGINLNHHDALSDAIACAKLFILHNRKVAKKEVSGTA
ncbi:3'-5' exonuclease [Desertivirga brevis]|uniref:3'-5' exonuclease n=1 Tax=Desertivirga brevis TaxID=2810310 RepID=UPI001A968CD2|nr:3'-5' exonuclease [Pedobacter sp. SYSU D00873]